MLTAEGRRSLMQTLPVALALAEHPDDYPTLSSMLRRSLPSSALSLTLKNLS